MPRPRRPGDDDQALNLARCGLGQLRRPALGLPSAYIRN